MPRKSEVAATSGRRADSQQLVRQWALLRLLSASGRAFAVKELAEQLGVSKATVQRDLATLERRPLFGQERAVAGRRDALAVGDLDVAVALAGGERLIELRRD